MILWILGIGIIENLSHTISRHPRVILVTYIVEVDTWVQICQPPRHPVVWPIGTETGSSVYLIHSPIPICPLSNQSVCELPQMHQHFQYEPHYFESLTSGPLLWCSMCIHLHHMPAKMWPRMMAPEPTSIRFPLLVSLVPQATCQIDASAHERSIALSTLDFLLLRVQCVSR